MNKEIGHSAWGWAKKQPRCGETVSVKPENNIGGNSATDISKKPGLTVGMQLPRNAWK